MGQWQEMQLGDFLELKRGYDLPKKDRTAGEVPLVSSSGVSDTHSESKVKGPGVVTGRYGTIGQVFYVEDDFWPLNTTLYVKDFKGNDPLFVYYLLKTINYLEYSDKAAVPGVNRNHLHKAKIFVPVDSGVQREIAIKLWDLDQKIELNRQINQTLEQIAQAIFKSWFVDFEPVKAKIEAKQNGQDPERAAMCAISGKTDEELNELSPEQRQQLTTTAALFPYELEDSELGAIPKGWNVDSLATLMDIKGGTQPPSSEFLDVPQDGYVRLVQIRDYDTDAHPTYIPDTKKLRKTQPMDIMIGRYGAAVGRILWGMTGAYNVALVKVEFNNEYEQEFLRTYLLSEKFQGPLLMMSGRSAQSGFNKGDIASFKLAIPSAKILEKYQEVVLPIREKGLELSRENELLSKTRDSLLPKLLSGEISVNGFKCGREAVA
jgi:type I restriction enzyme S subunit